MSELIDFTDFVGVIATTQLQVELHQAVEEAKLRSPRRRASAADSMLTLAEVLATARKADLAVGILDTAKSIKDDYGRCRDLSEVAYVYARLGRYKDAVQAVESCDDEMNRLWRLYAYAMILRVRAQEVNATFRRNYETFDDYLFLSVQCKFNAPTLN